MAVKIRLKDMTDMNSFINSNQYFDGEIDVVQGRYKIDGRSFLGLCSLNFDEPMDVTLKTDNKNVEKDFYNMLKKWEVVD